MLGRTDSRLRMVAVMLTFLVIAGAAGLRLGQWQVVEAESLTAEIRAVFERLDGPRTVRADIVDRDGVLLAKTSSFDRVVAYPNIIDPADHEELVDVLGLLLDLDDRQQADYLEALVEGYEKGSKWVRLERAITHDQSAAMAEAIAGKALPGIGLEPQENRRYPRKGGEPGTSLASHLLGFVRADGRGGEGLELYYDEKLTTVDPAFVDLATVEGTATSFVDIDPEPLALTIDAKLQRQVEKELYSALVATKAKSVSAIVMDPETGAIVAAASVPAYDAEDFAQVASDDMSKLRNRVFSDQYEPGSVMKIFTVGAALDQGVVTPQTIIRDQKELQFWKYKVRNADLKSQGALSVKDVVAWSRNVATAKIARRLAPNSTQKAAHRLYDFWEKVGITDKTGVDIASEANGYTFDPDQRLWAPVDLANRAFGQGMSVTLPQLARGMSTLVNGGFLVQPHLATDGAEVEKERVIKAKLARQTKDILTHVTGSLPWYAEGALIPGYRIGGKTGTAQIWDVEKVRWKPQRWNHSFIGFIGGKKQEYVIAVRIEEPVPYKKPKQGQIPIRVESYELYQMVARATIKQLDMKKVKDPNAGRPIINTLAAERLDPVRNRQAKQLARQEARKEAKQAAKAAKAEQAKKAGNTDPGIGSDPAPSKRSSGGEGT